MEKKLNHQANIVRLGEPRVHAGADTLELYDIGGYQVVVKKGQFKTGDLAVYIQPDSVVPQTIPFKFIWEQYSTPGNVEGLGTVYTDVPERRRRITVRKFRKEWSEGLLMPIYDFPELELKLILEGADVSDLLGITHWENDESTRGGNEHAPRKSKRWPKSLKGWLFFLLFKIGINVNGDHHGYDREEGIDISGYDVEALKNHKGALIPGEDVIITEKIHGSQARYVYLDGHMYAGSRNLWKAPNSTCIWRKALTQNPWIKEYCEANPGNVVYGEVVPTQRGFKYGCEGDEAKFFVFDIKDRYGNFLPKKETLNSFHASKIVPILRQCPFELSLATKLASGQSAVAYAKNLREGVVITAADDTRYVRGLGRVQLKLVSNEFLAADSKGDA